ncbi:MAG: hypothetical protein FGM39_02635 [Phycisphaerales bacterium]|nr:hypothetical protein [Phycisphaerales bacterium]
MPRAADRLCVILFCALIGAMPLCGMLGVRVVPAGEIERVERRRQSQLPPFGTDRDAMRPYFAAIEPYACDRLAFRSELVSLVGELRRLAGAPISADGVVVGSDGWLFFGNQCQQGIDQHRGLRQLSADELSAIIAYWKAIEAELSRRGVSFLVMIAPDKHAVYPDRLPAHLSEAGRSPTDQLMGADLGSLRVLDLRPTMIEARRGTELALYHRNDSHWNDLGAYVAYRAMLRALAVGTAIDCADGDFIRVTSTFGDLVPLAGRGFEVPTETTAVRHTRFEGTISVTGAKDESPRTAPSGARIRVTDELGFVATNPARDGTILVIGDSFLDGMVPFLNQSFGTVVYQHSLHFGDHSVAELVDRHRPQAVVFEMVGRLLVSPVPLLIPPASDDSSEAIVLPNERIPDPTRFSRGIEDRRIVDGDVCFRAVDHDPYFHLPPVPPMPAGAKVTIDITLPDSRMVQLYYQPIDRPRMSEERSLRMPLPAGRHRITMRIGEAMDGVMRLDPGNGPGEYRIHEVRVLPLQPATPSK